MAFINDGYMDFIKLRRIKSNFKEIDGWKRAKCMYCKRFFNKGDYYIGSSRRRVMVCRKCSVNFLKVGVKECETLKSQVEERIADLEGNKEAYDKEEMLNDL